MFATLFSLTLLVALAQTVLAQSGFMIDTPNFVQCQEAQITWTASVPPYDLVVVPADDPCGDAIEDLGNQTSQAVTWNVNLAAGTQVVLYIEDAAGNNAWSGTITVGGSGDASCLPATTSSAPASSAPAPSATLAPTTLTVPDVGGATPAGAAAPSSSPFAPAGAANAGIVPTSGALSTRPLSAIAVVGSALIAAAAFAL